VDGGYKGSLKLAPSATGRARFRFRGSPGDKASSRGYVRGRKTSDLSPDPLETRMMPYYFSVLMFLLSMPTRQNMGMERSTQVASLTTWAAGRRDPALYFPKLAAKDPEAARVKLAKIYAEWIVYESNGRGDVAGDGGSSCGIMQVKPWHVKKSCEELRKNNFVGITAGADVLEGHVKQCNGNLKQALGAYSGRGKCEVFDLVTKRCNEIGPNACDDVE
jgi:hypothetical protein